MDRPVNPKPYLLQLFRIDPEPENPRPQIAMQRKFQGFLLEYMGSREFEHEVPGLVWDACRAHAQDFVIQAYAVCDRQVFVAATPAMQQTAAALVETLIHWNDREVRRLWHLMEMPLFREAYGFEQDDGYDPTTDLGWWAYDAHVPFVLCQTEEMARLWLTLLRADATVALMKEKGMTVSPLPDDGAAGGA